MAKVKIYSKETVEQRRYEFDYSLKQEIADDSETVDTIIDVTFTPADGALNVVGSVISPDQKMVQAVIEGGTSGVLYVVKCEVATSGGARLVVNGKLKVHDLLA